MVRIRPAVAADSVQINHIFAQWLRFAQWDDALRDGTADFESVSEGERVFVGCREDNVAVGLISVWEPESFIHHLYVDEAHRHSGVGTLLLASLDGWLMKPWRLKCDKRNTSALDFYYAGGWYRQNEAANADDTFWLLEFA